ncbi:dynamin family protein [Mesobacillus jeotgali]|uniref:dynamin family protein n=1 Tax=Mesobacillus jeotgali TaxID=129985 RepID=UPI00177D3140|nr:dynamin family protein [Mesobacillus jeotgali]UYZ21765.1 dynamin family protein [Mesobacillus jeotgali]
MSYTEKKEIIQKKAAALRESLVENIPESSQMKMLLELEEDLAQDYYTVMVVGEFKHGKSTFVNALLGQDIMPRDVTPTTATINAVFHSEKPALQILKNDGQVEMRTLSKEQLDQYTASADFNVDDIKYLKLFMTAPLLKDRVVLIDTPGVNDLNQQRSDVTFQFLPRADVVIFMTSITAAMKQTEVTFIQEFLLKNGLDKILFAANFMDRIDEEELDETIDFVERRIQNTLSGEKPALFPMSAKEALEGKVTGDAELLQYSGIPEIEAEIARRIESGTRSMEKLERFNWRLHAIAEGVLSEIETAGQLSSQSVESLAAQVDAVTQWFEKQDIWKGQLQNYLLERKNEIKYMVRKSVQHFGGIVKEDIENRIRLFYGADVKNLVEAQIPIAVKSHFNQWTNQYSDYIHELLRKTQAEVSKGLSSAFKQSVAIQAVKGEDLAFTDAVPMLRANTGNANVKAGVLLGGASTLVMLLGGPFFLPLVGMAGLPFLSQKLAEKQLENIKPELISNSNKQIGQLVDNLEDHLEQYINQAMKDIEEESFDEFTRLLRSYEVILKGEIKAKQNEAASIRTYQEKLNGFNDFIKDEILEGVAVG